MVTATNIAIDVGRVWLSGRNSCMNAPLRWEPLRVANGPWVTFGGSFGSLCGLLRVGEGTHAPSFGCSFPAHLARRKTRISCLVAQITVPYPYHNSNRVRLPCHGILHTIRDYSEEQDPHDHHDEKGDDVMFHPARTYLRRCSL
jgi:hypothetical protein